MLLLPDTSAPETQAITNRIIRRISHLRWVMGDYVVTSSVSTCVAASGSASTVETLLAECDARLCEAKNAAGGGERKIQLRV